jgi:acetyl esterase/lipase
VHDRSAEWHLDTHRIGVIGTSAGGGVGFGALLAGALADAKPDFLISIFGPALQDVAALADAPPLFLVTEGDHGPVTDGLLAIFSIWKAAGQRAELHVYDVPVFSMSVDLWGGRLFEWMAEQHIIPEGKR